MTIWKIPSGVPGLPQQTFNPDLIAINSHGRLSNKAGRQGGETDRVVGGEPRVAVMRGALSRRVVCARLRSERSCFFFAHATAARHDGAARVTCACSEGQRRAVRVFAHTGAGK